jgi:hypothetical protein
MTESEWLVCSDPEPMLDMLRGKAGDRELRLFACACCRRQLAAFFDPASWCLCEVAERFVDGLAEQAELDDARFDVFAQYCGPWYDVGDRKSWENIPDIEARSMIGWVAYSAAGGSVRQQDEDRPNRLENAREAFHTMKWVGKGLNAENTTSFAVGALRDIFGNPGRQPVFDPAWASWQTGRIPRLARTLYRERAFDRLPLLADILAQTGCTDQAILSHCRDAGENVRGCWVLDLLMGVDRIKALAAQAPPQPREGMSADFIRLWARHEDS